MKSFKTVNVMRVSITDNVFRLIGKDNFLITAGHLKVYNTMTAAWATMGFLWNRCLAIIFVRPQRHTFHFTERFRYFTLSFFEEKYRPALDFCGTHSGRDCDKAAVTGLTPIATAQGSVAFKQARLILECRKLYAQDLASRCFLDRALRQRIYPRRDFHRFYIGEIVNCYVKTKYAPASKNR